MYLGLATALAVWYNLLWKQVLAPGGSLLGAGPSFYYENAPRGRQNVREFDGGEKIKNII